MMVVLFVGLAVILVVLVRLIGIVKNSGAGNQRIPAGEKPALAPVAAGPSAEQGVPGEIVAAIAAAVSCLYDGKPAVIREIRRADRSARSPWAAAGLLENTRPF